MKDKIKIAALMLTLLGGLLSMHTVESHHSVAAVDLEKTVTVSGIVKNFEWTNPHAWIWVVVNDPKAGPQEFGFECAALTMLRRGGWTRDVLKPGDKVTVKYHPLKDGKNGGMFMEAEFADGKKVGAVGGG